MRRIKYLLLAGLLAVGGLTGCQKKEVHPGDVKGYEEGEEQTEADSTIIAISQGPRNRLIRTTVGLEGSDKGLLIVDENHMTTRKGIFAAGDTGFRRNNFH